MLKSFVRDGAIYGVLRVLTGGMTVLLLPLYTRMLRPAEYGVVDVVVVCSSILMVVLTLDVVQGFARHYADAGDEQRTAYASTTFWFTLASFGTFAALVAVIAPRLSVLAADSIQYGGALRVAALSLVAQALMYVVLTDLRFALRPWAYAAASLVFTATSVGGAVVFVGLLRFGVQGVFVAQLVANVSGLVVALILARADFRLRFNRERLGEMLHFSAPLVLSSVGVLAATYADRFAVRSLLTIAALGVYAVGARAASAVALAVNAFQTALSPLIYKHYAEPDAPRQIERLFRWFVALLAVMVTFIGAFSFELVRILAAAEYAGAAQIVFLLALAGTLSNLYLFAPGLWIAKRTGVIAIINVTAAAVTLAANVIVVPLLGIRGAAIVSCCVALAGFAVQLKFAQSSYAVPYRWMRIGGAAAIMVVFALLVVPTGAVTGGVAAVAMKLAAFVAFSAAFVVVLIDPGDLGAAMRRIRRPLRRPPPTDMIEKGYEETHVS